LNDVFLKHSCGFGVVSIQAVEDSIDVFWTIGRIIKGNPHVCDFDVESRWRGCGVEIAKVQKVRGFGSILKLVEFGNFAGVP
jgi:hypothetical protein